MSVQGAAAVGIPIVSDILGSIFGSGDRGKADQYTNASIKQIQDVVLPRIQDQIRQYQQLKSQGQLSPQQEQAMLQAETALKQISVDPRFKQAQISALSALQEIGKGGMTAADELANQKFKDEANRNYSGKLGAIKARTSAQGTGGTGADMAMQMQAAQDEATQQNQNQLATSAESKQRALDAIIKGGQLGGQMGAQDFNQQAQIGSAQDAINRFNTSTRQDVQQRNINRVNDAQKYNLDSKQRIADANVGIANNQQDVNKNLYQNDYNNRMGKAKALADVYAGGANQANKNANNTSDLWGKMGSTVGGFLERQDLSDSSRQGKLDEVAEKARLDNIYQQQMIDQMKEEKNRNDNKDAGNYSFF